MARLYPDEVGYRNLDESTSLTFAAWEADSNRLARGLIRSGVARGERVSIYLPGEEVLAWVVAYAAVHKAGAVAVPTNTRMSVGELASILGHAEATVVITSPELLGTLAAAGAGLASIRLAVVTDSRTGRSPKQVLGPGPGVGPDPFVRGVRPDLGHARVTTWDEILDQDEAEVQVPISEDAVADIMYTSGTTGSPKAVVVRHANASVLPNNEPAWGHSGWLHASPLFSFAGIAFVYTPMKLGLSGLFLARFDPGRWLEVVAAERPWAAFIVPAMAQLIIAHPDFETADLSSLALCSLGSAPVAAATLRRLQDKMPGATVSNGYGMTEAGPAYCTMPKEESTRRIGSVGQPMAPMEVRIVDAGGSEVGVGEVGEVTIHLPGRQREYYRDDEATAHTWVDGWLHSGDLGRLDEDGYLYIVGRMKDVIIRGGNNIYATEVEAALLAHPGVLEAAVIGVPHPVLGEDVAAFVVARDSSTALLPDDLREHCAERLADYKVPRQITLIDELPHNATGKILKRQLVVP